MEIKNLAGMKFGRLTVIKQAPSKTTPNGTIRTMWECNCNCGAKGVVVSSQGLRKGVEPSCGCAKREKTSKRTLDDLSGKRFGRLVVQKRDENAKCGMTRWKCLCDCGNECSVLARNLVSGHTVSCGCYRNEVREQLQKKHGYKGTRIYGVWEKIKSRCCNPDNPSYSRYGGRGITICDEWRDNPEAFIEWAYANGYDENAKYGECTVDRIDNSKGYSPDNCRFANEQTQANNRRTNKRITYNGETHTVAEWARILGINQSTLNGGLWSGKTLEYYMTEYTPRNTHPKH